MRIAITTPTGTIGRALVRELLHRDEHELILLARRSATLELPASASVRVFRGDLQDPAYVKAATTGVDALFWVISPGFQAYSYRAAQRDLAAVAAEAALSNRIQHLVLLSSFGAHLSEHTGAILGFHDAEEIVGDAAESVSILRPGYLMENYLWHLSTLRQMQAVFLPVAGTAHVPMVSARDVALAAADTLSEPATPGKHLRPLLGPRDLTFDQAAGILGDGLNQPVEHVTVSTADAHKQMTVQGMSPDVARRIVQMYSAIEAGYLKPAADRSPASTTPTELATFVRRVLAPSLFRSAAG